MRYDRLNQQEAQDAAHNNLIALVPVGAVEVHGDHLPLGTDCFLASALTERIEQALGQDRCAVLPCVPYGQVWSLGDKPGSIHIPDAVLSAYLAAIAQGLHRSGIGRVAFINGHVGNCNAIKDAMRALEMVEGLKTYSFTYPGANALIKEVCTTPRAHSSYFHACEIETSYMLCLCPEQVRMERAIRQYPDFPPDFEYTPTRWSAILDRAVLGDATAATAEKGERILSAVVHEIVRILV